MGAVSQAVILAAGSGTRIARHIGQMPKGFIELSGRALVERSVDALQNAGIERVLIVTGHLAHFYEELAERSSCVETVHNQKYADSGSMYSLYCARELIDDDFLLLESDIVYERRALQELQHAGTGDLVLVSGPTQSGDEVYVGGAQGRITKISKDQAEVPDSVGELVGICRISRELLGIMCESARKEFGQGLHLEYESDTLCSVAQDHPVNYLLIADLAWAEIDDVNHLERARAQVFPKILEADRKSGGQHE